MILMVAQAESAKDAPNSISDKQLAENITQQLSQLKQKESWSIKDKFIVGWIIICFISTLIISVVIAILIITYIVNSKDPQFTSECKSLNNKLNRRLKELLLNTSLIKIISITNSSLIFKSDYNTNLYDELINTNQITGPFQFVCGEEREFNYTDSIKVWHTDKCCYKTSMEDFGIRRNVN
jgi:hypothetical protein